MSQACIFCQKMIELLCCPSLYWQQEGGEKLEFLIDFILAVGASIAAHYVSKWLDRHHKGK